jgi:hypothetical protein
MVMALIIPRGHGGSQLRCEQVAAPGTLTSTSPRRHRTVDTADELTLGPAFAISQSLAATVLGERSWRRPAVALNPLAEHILTMEPPGTAVRNAVSPGHARP